MTSVITKDKILAQLHKQANWNKTSIPVAIVLMLCIGIFLLWAGATKTADKSLAMILCAMGTLLLALSVFMVVVYIKILRSYRNQKHLSFWLTKDVCVRKKLRSISTESGDSEVYDLYFEAYGKFQLDTRAFILPDDADRSICKELLLEELFQNTNEGDVFYLIFTSESNPTACIALPSSQWELPAEHTTTEGKIYLNK